MSEPLYNLATRSWDKTCPCILAEQQDPECPWHGRDAAITRAVDAVARQAISAAAEPDLGQEVEWGNYPEIGEYDWQLVIERVNELRRSLAPPPEVYTAAYALLESRAES